MTVVARKTMALYNEDCLTGIPKRIKPGTVDVVVTSPPYNIGVKYLSYNDRMPKEKYLTWLSQWGDIVADALTDDGSLFLNIGSRPSAPEVPFQVLTALTGRFALQNVIHWIKSIYIEADSYGQATDINVGHYKPINSDRFLNDTHEYIFHLTKTGKVKLDRLALGVPYKDRSNISRWKSGNHRLRCRGNCWFIPYETIQHRDTDRPHPASYPPRLAENCIRLHGLRPGMHVLDPFLGIGNSAVACRNMGVAFTGFEIDAYYFQVAKERLEDVKTE